MKELEELLKISEKLVTTMQLPENKEDYPLSVPKHVRLTIHNHNNKLRELAVDIREIYMACGKIDDQPFRAHKI